MSYQVDAIYDQGILRPLEPLLLPDQSRVKLTVELDVARTDASPTESEGARAAVESQRRAARELDAELAGVPDLSPRDGWTSAEHDQILYGRPA